MTFRTYQVGHCVIVRYVRMMTAMNLSTARAEVSADADAEVGRRVHMLMWDRQITQSALAPQLGIEQSALSKKLRGHRGWSVAELIVTASALGTTVGYLVGEVEEVPSRITERNLASVIEITEAPSRRLLEITAEKSA